MRTLQRATDPDAAAIHARFLSSVSRHMMSLELEPMLEAVAHAALPLLGDACAIDRLAAGIPTRLLEVRIRRDAWIEHPADLAATVRPEIRADRGRSRLSVPIAIAGERSGLLTFVARRTFVHGQSELALVQELAERLALAIQNVRTHARLRQSLAERERLISIAAHELRGPACSLRLCLQALRRSERKRNGAHKSTGDGSQLMDIMVREERRLARLIDDLLDLARARSGQLHLVLEDVDLCDVVRDVTSRMTPEAERAGCRLEIEMGETLVGHWDRARLDQVVTNLLGNAIKFGERRPIGITATSPSTGTARLCITDHGLGIHPEQQQDIFEPFKRAVAPTRYEGLGLGLYIVRNIVGQLGGNVAVQSAPGAGSTFIVDLPLPANPQLQATG